MTTFGVRSKERDRHGIVPLDFAVLVILGMMFFATQSYAQPVHQHPLVEEGTSTFCGWCPYEAYALDSLPRFIRRPIVVLAWHGLPGDPMYLRAADSIPHSGEWPWLLLNRSNKVLDDPTPLWDIKGRSNLSRVLFGLAFPAAAPLSVQISNATYSAEDSSVDFDVMESGSQPELLLSITQSGDTTITHDSLRYIYTSVAVLTEDGIVSPQEQEEHGKFRGGIIQKFRHDNVVRAVGGSVLGDTIAIGALKTLHFPLVKHYHMPANNPRWDRKHLRIKAFVQIEKLAGQSGSQSMGWFVGDNVEAAQTEYITHLPRKKLRR